VVSIRGEILAVLDTAVMLGLPPSSRDPSSRILIVEPDGRAAGLLVDALGAIRTADAGGLGPIPPTVSPSVAAVLSGVLTLPEHPVGVIDVARLFAVPELAPFVRKGQDAIEESSSP
jgi:purine-binding chemotaxis protein CheW